MVGKLEKKRKTKGKDIVCLFKQQTKLEENDARVVPLAIVAFCRWDPAKFSDIVE